MRSTRAGWIFALSVGLHAGAFQGPTWAQGQPQTKPQAASPDPRQADRAAIRATMQSLSKAIAAGDAKAVASHWTTEGEYQGDQGDAIQGRAALETAYSAFFKATPKVQIEAEPGTLRFLSRDTAVEEGYVTIRRDPSQPANAANYSAYLVREDGRWRIALLSESASDEASPRDLAWLIGDWKSPAGEAAEVLTTYAWDAHKKFIRVRFVLKSRDRTLEGFQVIGKDPGTGDLRAWTFEAEGGIGEAVWNKDGDHWVAESVGTLADGSTLIATNVLRRVNDDTFTWQSIGRTLDDEPLPDLPPVKVTRVKTTK